MQDWLTPAIYFTEKSIISSEIIIFTSNQIFSLLFNIYYVVNINLAVLNWAASRLQALLLFIYSFTYVHALIHAAEETYIKTSYYSLLDDSCLEPYIYIQH